MNTVRYLNINDVVALTQIRYHTVWLAAIEGRIPFSKIAGKWMAQETDLPAILKYFEYTKLHGRSPVLEEKPKLRKITTK